MMGLGQDGRGVGRSWGLERAWLSGRSLGREKRGHYKVEERNVGSPGEQEVIRS